LPWPELPAVTNLRDDAFEAYFAGVLEHFAAVNLKAFAELDIP
jgi:hypothetical protein